MILAAQPAGQVAAERQEGSGRLLSSSTSYALGALTYVISSGGRGVLDLKLGSGSLLLSGSQADQTSPTTWALKIDTLRIVTQRPVTGTCDLEFTSNGRGYRSLTCRGVIRPDAEPFSVSWRGDGTPTRRLPAPAERP